MEEIRGTPISSARCWMVKHALVSNPMNTISPIRPPYTKWMRATPVKYLLSPKTRTHYVPDSSTSGRTDRAALLLHFRCIAASHTRPSDCARSARFHHFMQPVTTPPLRYHVFETVSMWMHSSWRYAGPDVPSGEPRVAAALCASPRCPAHDLWGILRSCVAGPPDMYMREGSRELG